MLLFGVFCIAAVVVILTPKLAFLGKASSGARPEGIGFVAAVLVASLAGLLLMPQIPGSVVSQAALPLLAVTAVLYGLSAIRGKMGLPPFVADLFVLAAAAAALKLGQPTIQDFRLPFTNNEFQFGGAAATLTVFWVWAISRMTAALNRTPQVTGGYLGLVGLTFLALLKWSPAPDAASQTWLPGVASAALAGAGLATVPLAIKRPNFNIGWSGALTMGFLLAQVSVSGLLSNAAFAILGLLLLVFGIPLLDVSFYRLSASRRGKEVNWEHKSLRLHEALVQRGFSPAKITALYLAMTAALCALGVIVVVTATWNLVIRLLLVAGLLFAGFVLFFSVIRVLMRRLPDEEVPESIEAFGMKISPVSMAEAIDKVEEFILSKQPHHVVTSDANAILRAQEDPEYAAIVRRAALITPDGYGVMWGARLLNLPVYERVTGVDMVDGICARAARKGYSIYILGSAPGVAALAAEKLAAKHPGLTIAGTQHGYFSQEGISEEEIAAQINAARPDVLFVAFGIPKQEKFIAKHMAAMNVPVSVGVGGSFDVYSEKLKRAPIYIQRSGMEWLYRVWQEPSRWKRMSYVPRFMVLAIKVWLFGDRSKPA